MAYSVDNVSDFKQLVLSGLPKLITGSDFESQDEMEATFSFVASHGIPFDTNHFANFTLREKLTEDEITVPEASEQYRERAAGSVAESVSNFFSGMYGV